MIKLTKADGTKWYPTVEHIIEVDMVDGYTVVRTRKDGFYVKESPEEVVRKIMEYKLGMVRYGAAYAEALRDEDADAEVALDANIGDLYLLTGLEDTDA